MGRAESPLCQTLLLVNVQGSGCGRHVTANGHHPKLHGGPMPEKDVSGAPKTTTCSREEAVRPGPNRYGYDPGLWPPRN